MKTINLTVNGKAVTAAVEPRTHLADFLREGQLLTGTHLGCEHGVCGACTLLIDGSPARSCITYAVACDGAEITTIEGLDEDATMRRLRDAFSREHGLQCGYCTPGMLITARDIVTRLPDADDRRLRFELSGNLCRCTGYVGIVRAVRRVIEEGRKNGSTARPEAGTTLGTFLGPVGSGHARTMPADGPIKRPVAAATTTAPAAEPTRSPSSQAKPGMEIRQSFTVDHPRDRVWAFFDQIDQVAACMPGASLTAPPRDDHVTGKIRIKLGPISADFAGDADIERDAANKRGVIRGGGLDTRSRSSARGEIRYALFEEKGGTATRVEVDVGFTLTGPLAQFSRSGIVNDLASRLTAAFAQNLRARMDRAAGGSPAEPEPSTEQAAELNAGSLVLSVLWARIKSLFGALFRR
jgi:aerobic carbon-monoxide dehydrogenase small subunit